MTGHLSSSILSALADGELSTDQLTAANEHLAGCPACTSDALAQSLLKSATARAGRRYELGPQLQQQLAKLAAQTTLPAESPSLRSPDAPASRSVWWSGLRGWSVAAVLILVCVSIVVLQRTTGRAGIASAARTALVTEVCDQHIATLAASLPPQVISTDRHTVKPWFQGKLPFSFNLPDKLPADTTLDGANLTYLHNQPVAQLLYSIGRHRVSVFAGEKLDPRGANQFIAEHSGFHVVSFSTADLEVLAVSDVDPARLSDLARRIEEVQSRSNP
jgi:anti-sigma factor RsiW